MKIQFQGHIDSLSVAFSEVAVKIIPSAKDCQEQSITVLIPRSDSANWLPGKIVFITIDDSVSSR